MSAPSLKTYRVTVRAVLVYSGSVEAASAKEARRLAHEAWHCDELHTEEECVTSACAWQDAPD
jgi:hypothetical protein